MNERTTSATGGVAIKVTRGYPAKGLPIAEIVDRSDVPLFFGSDKYVNSPSLTAGMSVEFAVGPAVSVPRIAGLIRFQPTTCAVVVGRWPNERLADTALEIVVEGKVIERLEARGSLGGSASLEGELACASAQFKVNVSTLGKAGSVDFLVRNQFAPTSSALGSSPPIPDYDIEIPERYQRCVAAIVDHALDGNGLPSKRQLAARLRVAKGTVDNHLEAIAQILHIPTDDRIPTIWEYVRVSNRPYEWIAELDAFDKQPDA